MQDAFPALLASSVVEPPSTVWAGIALKLDTTGFAETLYHASVLPPSNAWDKISTSLDEPAKPANGKMVAFVRYAVAAAIIAAIAFGATRLLINKESRNELVNESSNLPQVPVAQEQQPTTVPGVETQSLTQEERNDAALEASKHSYAALDASDKLKLSRVTEDFFAPAATISVSAAFAPENTYRDVECTDVAISTYTMSNPAMDMASRYALLMRPDGQIIRISRKLGNLVCCVSGEEQDAQCTDQLNKWKEKMANASVAPAPGNFMGILDILHSLRDNGL
jgi:hypothetical protein